MSIKNNHIVSTAFSVTGLLLVSKLLGFIKQLVTASTFGTTLETDLISLSQDLIGNLQYLLVQAVLSALIAVYLHTAQQGEDAAKRFSFDVWKALTVITAGVVLLVELFAPWLARLIAPSYPDEQLVQLSRYLRLFAPVLLLLVWIAVFNGLLHANKRFIPGEMISVHQSLFLIVLTVLLAGRLGVGVLVLAFFASNLWNAGYTALLSRRYWRVSHGSPFRNPAVRRLLRMMLPLLLGYSLVYVNQMVDKALVSGLDAGAVTALGYAAVLSNLVGTFIITFASMLFAYVTSRIAAGDENGAVQLTERTSLLLSVTFLPISILTVLLSEEIVTIVYARGAFDAESVRVCAQALRGYALMFAPMIFQEVYSRFLYGFQDSKKPMVNSSVAAVCNIALSIALCPRFGVAGITVATSISVALGGALNLYSARREHPELHSAALLRALPWLLVGCAACGVAAHLCAARLAGQSALIRFVLAAMAGFVAYAVAAGPLLLRLWRQFRRNT
mgnify:CR=1 FL=1